MEFNLESVLKWINYPILQVGESPVTISGLAVALGIVILALIASGFVQKMVATALEKKFKLESGLIYTIQRFVHYLVLILGMVVATQVIGLDLGSLAVVFGFLSVGIGFGLQNITSNFISGLILLIERPVSVGDMIEVGGRTGKVKKINMRSTIVMTFDNVAIIVPNSQLIENQVVNWSAEDRKLRLHCPIGVAYGSDIQKMKGILLSIAENHSDVLKSPQSEVRFVAFGDSSLNFELLAWMRNPILKAQVLSDLNYAIDEAFRKEGIQIPFPQRDVHMKNS